MFLNWHEWFASGRVHQPELEVISRTPRRRVSPVPLVFVHGAFAGAWCWDFHFLDFFAERGFECHALSLRGHGSSRGKRALQQCSLDDYAADIATVVDELDRAPVLIGHSMGGFLVQRYLERAVPAAAVLLAAVPPSGLMESSLRMFMQDPMLLGQLMMLHSFGPPVVDHRVAARSLFSDGIPAEELARVSRLMQPESQRAIWELHTGPLPRKWHMAEVPMLVLGAARDSLIAPESVRRTGRYFGVEAQLEPEMGHAMMLEPGWATVAGDIDRFLKEVVVN